MMRTMKNLAANHRANKDGGCSSETVLSFCKKIRKELERVELFEDVRFTKRLVIRLLLLSRYIYNIYNSLA